MQNNAPKVQSRKQLDQVDDTEYFQHSNFSLTTQLYADDSLQATRQSTTNWCCKAKIPEHQNLLDEKKCVYSQK